MAYKRNVDRLPIIPADAKEQNVVCHYCIVGCGYKAYTWDVNSQGGTAPAENKFGVDLSQQQEAETAAWYAPSMYNIVKQDGRDVHLVIKPDKDCVVNSGLGSIRGARMAEMSLLARRATPSSSASPTPVVWRYGQMQPTSWDDALDLVARVTAAVIKEQGEDGLFVSAFDHGGAGGGYENTWGTGKLYFGAMKVKNIRIHNRPAYNSEVHATRDMGVGELNNCYEDAELADTIFAVGTNALETQTNYFLNHWVPNLRGTSVGQEAAARCRTSRTSRRGSSSSTRAARSRSPPARPRPARTGCCTSQINSGTDLALFNALLTHVADQGWLDRDFIAAHTSGFDEALKANRTSLDEAARITGLKPDDIAQGGALDRRAQGGQAAPDHVRLREGPDLGQRQLPHQRRAREPGAGHRQRRPARRRLRAHGRPPGGLRPALGRARGPARRLRRPAADRGQGRRPPRLGLRPLQDDAERARVQARLQAPHRHGEGRHERRALRRPRGDRGRDHGRDPQGRAVRGRRRHRADPDRAGLPRLAAGRDLGRDEPDLDERRAADAADRALHGPAGAGDAGLPDRRPDRQPHGARAARDGRRQVRRPVQGLRLEDRRRRLHGRLPPEREGRAVRHLRAPAGDGHQRLPGAGGRLPGGRTARRGRQAGQRYDAPGRREPAARDHLAAGLRGRARPACPRRPSPA